MVDTEKSCGGCSFFDLNFVDGGKHSDVGQCVRYPPRVVSDSGKAKFPLVSYVRWCGEWSACLVDPYE